VTPSSTSTWVVADLVRDGNWFMNNPELLPVWPVILTQQVPYTDKSDKWRWSYQSQVTFLLHHAGIREDILGKSLAFLTWYGCITIVPKCECASLEL